MSILTFDKLAYVDRLTGAGIPEKDARAHADGLDIALREQVATKADVEDVRIALKADIAEVKAELKADISEVKAELKADIAEVKAELKIDIATVKGDLIKWVLGSQLVMAGFILSVLKFFGH